MQEPVTQPLSSASGPRALIDPASDPDAGVESRLDEPRHAPVSPWAYMVTLYLPFGIMTAFANPLAVNLFKLLNYSNQVIGLLGGVGLVAAFRFAYAPWLDGLTTKRRLSLATLWLAAICAFLFAYLVYFHMDHQVVIGGAVVLLLAVAVVGAAHETAADGYYIRALAPDRQAEFIGIKTAAIRCGGIFALVVLLLGATKVAAYYGATGVGSTDKTGFHIGFSAAFGVAGLMMVGFVLYNTMMIPQIPQDQPVHHRNFGTVEVIREYFSQPKISLVVLLLLIYRLGEGFLVMKVPFYLDPVARGGLGTPATAIPYIAMISDMPWMIFGGVVGGYIIKHFGLRRTFVPMVLLMNLPNLFYVWLAWAQPQSQVHFLGESLNISLLIGSSIESLGYGMSFSAMFYYMHITATESGRNKTSNLAISFALMNVGWTLPGMMSGYVQAGIGYTGLFLISSFVGLGVLLLIPFLPMPKSEQPQSHPMRKRRLT